jgi:hypothetical protein
MNIGLNPNADGFSAVVLHQFGHCLGMVDSPGGPIDWNRAEVIKYAWTKLGWSARMVEEQIFGRFRGDQTQFEKSDPNSIMRFAFPKEFARSGAATVWNTKLSDTDIEFVQKLYRKA